MDLDPSAPGTLENPPGRVAVIGLGSMGGAMAHTLQRAGWDVTGHDPSPAARAAAQAAGVTLVSDVADLAGTPHVVLSLPSAAVVAATVPVLFSRAGTGLVLDTTTSEPETSCAMAAIAARYHAHFVDSPVSGGRAGAESGSLSAFVGGSAAAVRAAGPLLNALTGGNVRVVGGSGAGNVVKLLNNVLCATNLIAVAEALDVAAAYDLDVEVAAAAISGASGGSHVSANAFPTWVLSDRFDSGFALGLMARDVDLMLSVAAARDAKPALLAATHHAWQHALAVHGPTADFTRAPGTATTATDLFTPVGQATEGTR